MKLARKETTIPVPEVYIDTATGYPLVVIDLIEGDCLVNVWDGMSGEQKQHIIEQHRDHFS
jgi:hypothetical protein